jgi:hypothetical protein
MEIVDIGRIDPGIKGFISWSPREIVYFVVLHSKQSKYKSTGLKYPTKLGVVKSMEPSFDSRRSFDNPLPA